MLKLSDYNTYEDDLEALLGLLQQGSEYDEAQAIELIRRIKEAHGLR